MKSTFAAALFAIALALGICHASDNCSNPTSLPPGPLPGSKSEEAWGDHPAERSAWLLSGRRTAGETGLSGTTHTPPPARHLLESYGPSVRLPRLGLQGAPKAWASLGPAPQQSLYWGNVSGRVTSLAVDTRGSNHILYVGTAFGGLWQTADFTAGRPHFTPLGDRSWPSLAVGSIALDTSRAGPPTIYAGTGEGNQSLDSYYGIGILKSSDGGGTWALSTGTGPFVPLSPTAQFNLDGPFVGAAVSRIVVDPAEPKHLLISVSSSWLGAGKSPQTAIYESIDAGDSWHAMILQGATGVAYNATDLIYEPVHKAFYAAVQGLGIYKLDRGAAQWKPLASPFDQMPVSPLYFDRASLATRSVDGVPVLYVLVSTAFFAKDDPRNYKLSKPGPQDTGIASSSDEGATWRAVTAPPDLFGDGQGFYDQWIAAPGSQGLVLGGIDIWSTASSAGTTGAANLTNSYDLAGGLAHPESHLHSDQHAVALLDDTHWIVGNDGGIWRTDDAGTHWIDLNTDISSIQFMSVTPLPGGRDYLGGSQDNGTTLGGSSQSWLTTLTGDGGFTAGNPGQPAQFFTERFNVGLCRSDNSGKDWKTVVDEDTIPDGSLFYVPYQLLRSGHDEILLGTTRVWLGPAAPSPPGKGWRPISGQLTESGFIQSIASAPSSPLTVYVTTNDGNVFVNPNVHASNSLKKWTSLKTVNLPGGRVYSAIVVDPTDPAIAWLAVQGFGTGHVFRTENRGGLWKDVTPTLTMNGTPSQIDMPVNSILIDPAHPSNVYIATDVGVFVTINKGVDWQPHGSDLPRTAVLDLRMTSERKILAATHGRGAWIVAPFTQ